MGVPIRTLEAGAEFALACLPERKGVVVRIGEGGAVVRYKQARHVELKDGVSFDAPTLPVTISLESDVVEIDNP